MMSDRDKAATTYMPYLPVEQELIEEIEREKAMVVRELREQYGEQD
jgi:hypothetical protein